MTELALAVALAVTAAAARVALMPLTGFRAPFSLVFVTVVCATLLGGWRSGIATTIIGQALAWYLLVEPAYSIKLLSRTDTAAVFISTICQLIIVWIVALYQREIEGQQRVRNTLVNELNHRVKNTLAVVQSLAHQTLRKGSPDELALFEGRLQALAGAHNLLTRRDWEHTDLKDVIADALAPFAIAPDRLSARGPEFSISPKTAVNLTLVLHELATNALKYGALKNSEGRIEIGWTDGQNLPDSFVWRERDGPAVTPPTRQGFGTRLIQRGLAAELGAKVQLTFDPSGLVCRIEAGTP